MKSVFQHIFTCFLVFGIVPTLVSGISWRRLRLNYMEKRLERSEDTNYEWHYEKYPYRNLNRDSSIRRSYYRYPYPLPNRRNKNVHEFSRKPPFSWMWYRHRMRTNPFRPRQGKGFFSTIINLPGNIWNGLKKLKPLQLFKDIFYTIGSTGSAVLSKFGEYGSELQTIFYNLIGEEVNDLFDASDKPINYQLFTTKNKIEYHPMNKTGHIKGSHWDKKKKTKIIIHGFSPTLWGYTNTTIDLKGQLTLKNSYFLAGFRDNIIVADWTSLSRTLNYISAAAATRVAGADLAELLQNLYKQKNIKSFDDVHIIGFSLGAHVAGIAGRLVKEGTNHDIGRITGLDPAELLFGTVNGEVPKDDRFVLNKKDAKFVDIIHCNAGLVVGFRAMSGHADFYPNGGKSQPGCPTYTDLSCSHSRCWKLFSESIGSRKYPACSCNSWDEFIVEKCKCDVKEDQIFMGNECSSKARGSYYLKADIAKPYNETLVRSGRAYYLIGGSTSLSEGNKNIN